MIKKEDIDERLEDGSTVVEVAVIVPMIFIIIMGCIFLLFFFLDMGVVKSETMRCANEVVSEWRKETHRSIGEETARLKAGVNERLILTHLENPSVNISMGLVTVRADVSFSLGGKGLIFTACSKAAIDDREKWIRILSH